jgi:hypothetical protein
MTEQSELLCKDCVYSSVSLIDKIITFGNPHSFNYKCSRYVIESEYDPVVGKTTPASTGYCTAARMNEKVCGHNATKWIPKSKYGLFDLLKK